MQQRSGVKRAPRLLGCLVAMAAACASPKLALDGEPCAVATDCADGLICVPEGEARLCRGSAAGLGNAPPAAADSGASPPAEGGAADGAPASESGAPDA